MNETSEVVTVLTSAGATFTVSVSEAQVIDAAFDQSGTKRLVWVTANPETKRPILVRLNVDQVVYIANG